MLYQGVITVCVRKIGVNALSGCDYCVCEKDRSECFIRV